MGTLWLRNRNQVMEKCHSLNSQNNNKIKKDLSEDLIKACLKIFPKMARKTVEVNKLIEEDKEEVRN